jgi:hypothetical protein
LGVTVVNPVFLKINNGMNHGNLTWHVGRARKIILRVTSPTLEILLANPFLEEIPISAMLNLG